MNIKQALHQYLYPFYIRLWVERIFKVEKGQTIIDAGAYLGGFTFYAAIKVESRGRIIAFEPDPNNFRELKTNVKKSKLKNIVLVNKALGDINKKVEIESAGNFSSVYIKTFKNPSFTVKQITLDSEMRKLNIKKVDFIKINIEGAEIAALKGAGNILKNTQRIVISCHEVNGKNTSIIIKSQLKKLGFKIHVLKRKFLITDPGHIDVYGNRF